MQLPSPGKANSNEIAQFVDRIMVESDNDTRRQEWSVDAERAVNLYEGNHYTTAAPADQVRLVVNRVQNIIIALVAIQAGDQPAVTFTPRETGEPPLIYLNTTIPDGVKMAAELTSLGVQVDPMQPLPTEAADYVKELVDSSEAMLNQAAAAGLPKPPGVVPREVIVEVNDATSAHALQTVYDGMWEECFAGYTFVENVLNKNILGVQPTLYEFDDDLKQHVLTNVHPLQWFPEGINTDVSNVAYVVYEEPLDEYKAKAKWPELAETIDNAADSGGIPWQGSRSYTRAAIYDQQFQRRMIPVRTMWMRYWPYPLSAEEVAAQGKLIAREVPDAPASDVEDAAYEAIVEPDVGPEVGAEDGQSDVPPSASDASVPAPGGPIVPTRVAFFHPDKPEEEIAPTYTSDQGAIAPNPKWPARYGIRQITVVAGETVDDRECEFPTIPIPWNKNVPIPFSPYGQGEPKRLDGLQMAVNRLLSYHVTNAQYNAFPPEVIHQQVVDRLEKQFQKARTKPNQRIPIPRELADLVQGDLKKLVQHLDPPQMPADFWKLLDMCLQLLDKEGNQADVMAGNAAPGWSGETVKSLQNAASQLIRGKSMFTEFYLRQLAHLMVHSIVFRMEPADWARYLSKYPLQAIAAFHTRNKAMDRDITVSIKSAGGASQGQQTQQLIAAKQSGLPISDQTLMEALDVDPDAELQRTREWARQMQSVQAQPGLAANNSANGAPPGGRKPTPATAQRVMPEQPTQPQ